MQKKFNINHLFLLSLLITFIISAYCDQKITPEIKQINERDYQINLTFKLNPDEAIYTNSIFIASDNPNIEIQNWQTKNNFLLSSKELRNNFNILFVITKKELNTENINLFIHYLLTNSNKPIEHKINLLLKNKKANEKLNNLSITKTDSVTIPNQTCLKSEKYKTYHKSIWQYFNDLSNYTQCLVKSTRSIWIQLFLVFILGILMSFTPCIYPVIPITAGILQMQGSSKSVFYNLLLSISYSLGIATTFATLGLIAATTGNIFGQIFMQPLFVIFISFFLIYLGLSMLGFYDMYTPKFLTTNKIKHTGTPFSAFLFGAVSGSIASPCLSPGLALLLTIVTSLANKILGFILLFSFGIGLSIPLMIIGTFSSSINVLPKAGMWMEEIKKLFGILLLAMSFYYLKNIIPLKFLLLLITITLFLLGIYYLINIKSYDSKLSKIFKNIFGVLLIASSTFALILSIQQMIVKETIINNEEDIWEKDFYQAKEKAIASNKKLIIDIGASFCTLCKAIDKYVFDDVNIKEYLKNFILVKVDATNTNAEPFSIINKKYKVVGVPTILIINPKSCELLKRFEGEIYNMQKKDILSELKKLMGDV